MCFLGGSSVLDYYYFVFFSFDVISDLQKNCKNSVMNSHIPLPRFTRFYILPHLLFSIYKCEYVILSPELLKSKLETVLLYALLCVSPKNKDILLHKHRTVVNVRTFAIDIILFFFFYFYFLPHSLRDLSSPTRD